MRTLVVFIVLVCIFQVEGEPVSCPVDSTSDTTFIQGTGKVIIKRIHWQESGSLSLGASITDGSIALANINHAEPFYGNGHTNILGNKFTIEFSSDVEWKIRLFARNGMKHIEVCSCDTIGSASLMKKGGNGDLIYTFTGKLLLNAMVTEVKYKKKKKELIISYSLE